MDGFIRLLTETILRAGVRREAIFYDSALELPGYFRPTKKWDLLVVQDGALLVALETKSQIGPSFGNNFNNRTEEAMGSALDIWTAYREGVFGKHVRPWLGYLFLLEDCPKSQSPIRANEPHFAVLPEFKAASYQQRYELFCRKLVLERHYDAACLLTSRRDGGGARGQYTEPADDLTFAHYVNSLTAQLRAFVGK